MRTRHVREASSNSVNWSDGSAAGWSTTAATSSTATAGSTVMPARIAGPITAASRSAADIAGTVTVASTKLRTEPLQLQRAVVEVGSERGDDTQPAVVRCDGVHQAVEKCSLLILGRQREQLLELIDDEQELAVVGYESAQDPIDHAVIGTECGGELARVLVGVGESDPTDTFGELLERRAARQHRRHEPRGRTRAFSRAHARRSPARTMLDLPLPEAPTTTIRRPRRSS